MSIPRFSAILKKSVSLDVTVLSVCVAILIAAYGVTSHWEQYSRANACMGKKHQINRAIEKYWQRHPKTDAQDITLSDLIKMRLLESILQCSQGGAYQVIPVDKDAIRVHCTYPRHGRDRLVRRKSVEKK